jgi:uroporphyrinogen-III synthase
MRFLVTRPLPEAERTAAALRACGHEAIVAPVLRIETVRAEFGAGPFAGLVVTSANAARALKDHPRRSELASLPVFAVGARSAAAVREIGCADVVSADGSMRDVAALLSKRFAGMGAQLLYLAGEDRAGDLTAALAPHGIRVEAIVVYRAVPEEKFAEALANALGSGPLDGALHYSRRSAAAFLAGAAEAGLTAEVLALRHFCLSAEVAAPFVSAGARKTSVARQPDEPSLLAQLRPA